MADDRQFVPSRAAEDSPILNEVLRENTQELHSLHIQLAEIINERRAWLNSTSFSVLIGFFGFSIAFNRYIAIDGRDPTWLWLFCGTAGMIIAGVWHVFILAYRRVDKEKFDVLGSMKNKFFYQRFRVEWELLERRRSPTKGNRRLALIEKYVPGIFAVLFCGLLVTGVFW